MRSIFILSAVLFSCCVFIMTACTKNNQSQPSEITTTHYSNINLLNQKKEIIQKAIAGRWQHVMDSTFGWAGWDVIYPQYDRFVSFSSNDSIKIESSGIITVYDKANYVWGRSVHTPENVFTLTIPNKIYWVMDKIYNDTLKIDAWPSYYFLIKKS